MFFLFRNGKLSYGGSLTTGKRCFSTHWLIACFLTAAPRKLLTNLVIFWGFLPPRDSTVRKKAPDMSRGLYSGLWEVFGSKYYIYKFKCFMSYELAVTIWMSVLLFLKCFAYLSIVISPFSSSYHNWLMFPACELCIVHMHRHAHYRYTGDNAYEMRACICISRQTKKRSRLGQFLSWF